MRIVVPGVNQYLRSMFSKVVWLTNLLLPYIELVTWSTLIYFASASTVWTSPLHKRTIGPLHWHWKKNMSAKSISTCAWVTLLVLNSNNQKMQENDLWAPIFKTPAISTALFKYFCFVLYCFWDTVLSCCADWLWPWDNPASASWVLALLNRANRFPVSILARKLKFYQCLY